MIGDSFYRELEELEELEKQADGSSRTARWLKEKGGRIGKFIRGTQARVIKRTRQSDRPAVRAIGRMVKDTHIAAPLAGAPIPLPGAMEAATAIVGAPKYVKGLKFERRMAAQRRAQAATQKAIPRLPGK